MKKNLIVFILMLFFVSLFAKNEMIFVEGGNMILGMEEHKRNQPHNVTLSDFYIAKYLVTMGEFKDFLTDTKLPFSWDGRITWDPSYLSTKEAVPTDKCPAQGMTWLYAVLYCNWLSEKENLIPCYEFPNGLNDPKIYENMRWNHKANGYRLPTEAEWEYAARGGQLSKGYKYPGSNNIDEVNKESAVSYEIGQMKPNELGVHDMGGLVSEYCYDWYDKKMWEWLPQENPCFETLSMVSEDKLPKVNDRGISQLGKVYKGADWYWEPEGTYSWRTPQSLNGASTTGIRLVRNYDEKSSINSNVTKTDFNSYEEKQDKQVTLVISKDGTVNINGTNLKESDTTVMEELKLRISDKTVFRRNTNLLEKGKINDTRVRLRTEPNLNCETLLLLDKGLEVKILERSKNKFTIDDEDWYWYRIETKSGKIGWVYGKYLDIENE